MAAPPTPPAASRLRFVIAEANTPSGVPIPYAPIVDVTARAFADYPLWRHVLPGDTGPRLASLRWLFWRLAHIDVEWDGAFYMLAYAADERGEPDGPLLGCAKAAWIPPEGSRADSLLANVLGGLMLAPFQLGLGGLLRLKAVGDANAGWHKKETAGLTGGHWYIRNVVVDPAHQSKGIGSATVRELLAELARRRSPRGAVYLDTNNEVNLPFYTKLGFQQVAQAVYAGSEVRHTGFLLPDQ